MITIDEAIEGLEILKQELDHPCTAGRAAAVELGREALKRVKACRHEYGCPLIDPEGRPEDIIAAQLLPGETTD